MSLSSAIRAPPSLKGIMCRIFTKYYTNLAEWNVLHIIATVSVSLAAVPIIFRLCVYRSSNQFVKSRRKIERLNPKSTVRLFCLFSKDSWQNPELPNVWQKKQVLNRSPEVIDYHIHSYMLTVLQLYQIILHIAPLKAVSIQTVDSHNCKYSQKSSVCKSWTAVNKKNNQTGRWLEHSQWGHAYGCLVLTNEALCHREQPSSYDCDWF